MLKLLSPDTTGASPLPYVQNPMLESLRGLKTLGGYSLSGKFPSLRLIAADGHESPAGLSDYFTVGLLNIFSERLKSALQNIGAELEFFPVTLEYEGRASTTEYFVGNLLRRISGLDLNHSSVELDEELGDALSVAKLVLDETKFDGVKIAVVDEIQRIIVSDDVIKAIQDSGCTGCIFIEPSEVRY